MTRFRLPLAALLLLALACACQAAPRSRLALYVLVGMQDYSNPANRHVRSPNPRAANWQRLQGVRASYKEVFEKTVEPCLNWLEGFPAKTALPFVDRPHDKLLIVDFERAFGSDERYKADGTLEPGAHYLGFQEELISRQYGLEHLTSSSFAAAAQPYIAAGVEVVAHSGSPNTSDPSDRWADDQIKAGRAGLLFRELATTDAPLLAAGVRVGRDGMELAKPGDLNWNYFQFYKSLGGLQQIEATPRVKQDYWPRDEVYRLRSTLFVDRHVKQTVPGWAKVGTPEFNALRDVRIEVLPSDLGGDQMDSDPTAGKERWKRLIDTIRPEVKKILKDCPNVTVELHHSIIERCIDLGVKASEWLP